MTLGFLDRVRLLSKTSFVRSAAAFQVGSIVNMGISFVSSVVYTRALGLEGFGVYSLSVAFAGLVGMAAGFGQDTATTTYLAEAVGARDDAKVRTVLRYFLQTSFAASAVYVLLAAFAPAFAGLLGANEQTAELSRMVLLNSSLQFPVVLLFLVLQITGRVPLVNVLENARNALQLAAATALLFAGFGAWGIVGGQLAVSILYVPLCAVLYARAAQRAGFPTLRSLFGDLGSGGTWTYATQGFWMALDKNISGNLHPNVFFMILNATSSAETVGLVRLALRLAVLPGSFILPAIGRTAAIAIPRLIARDRKAFKAAAIKLLAGSISLSAAAIVGAAIVVPPLVPIVYGEEFSGAVPSFLLLLLLNLCSFSQVLSVPLMRLYRMIHVNILNLLVGIAIAIGLYFWLATMLSARFSMSIAILYVHVHAMFVYVFLWRAMSQGRLKGNPARTA